MLVGLLKNFGAITFDEIEWFTDSEDEGREGEDKKEGAKLDEKEEIKASPKADDDECDIKSEGDRDLGSVQSGSVSVSVGEIFSFIQKL